MRKLVMALLVIAMFSMALVPTINAQGIEAWVSLNKTPYETGERGTMHIIIRNTGDDPIEVRNITIVFSQWMRYTEDGWDPLGNQTIVYTPAIIVTSKTATELDEITFEVPSDYRGHSTSVVLSIYTNKGRVPSNDIEGWDNSIQVIDSYSLRYLRTLDNIGIILTVVAILGIIGAIIVAAAIFLAGRRPGVTWQKEQ